MKNFLQFFFPQRKDFWVALTIGVANAVFVYLSFLQRHFISYRYLAYAVIIAISGTILTAWINNTFISPNLPRMQRGIKIFTCLMVFFLSIILLLNIRIEPVYYFLPDTTLEVTFTIEDLPQDQEGVRLLWIETGQGYVPYTYLDYEGQWERIFGNTIFSPGQPVTFRWTGKAGTDAEIAFRKTAFDQPMTISWNGVSESYNLLGNPSQDAFFRQQFRVPWFYFLPFILSFFITSYYLLFILLIVLGSWSLASDSKHETPKYAWLRFMLPLLLLWGFVLLILWPGILTNDSLTIWSMAESGQIDDWQSAFYTYLLLIFMHIIPSPGFVLFIQISLFAFVSAWGMSTLQKSGVSRSILWGLSNLMAIFPPSILYVVTLWKDIPYAIAFLAFTIAFFAITTSEGKWIAEKYHWVGLGIIAFLIGIFRHNGGPVALISLLILPFFYRKQWKYFLGSILIGLSITILVRGPLYDRITVDQESTGQSNLIYLHHIAAHLEAGTDLTPEEGDYLNSYLPLEDWDYTCCYVGNISYDQDFERNEFLSNTPRNRALAFSLFKRAPLVDIQHAFCAGEMSYQFMNNQQCWHTKSLHGFISTQPGRENWIGDRNRAGISEASLFPGLVEPLILALRPFGIFDANLVFYLRPAFWLFLSALSVSIHVIRWKSPRLLLTLLPVMGQSLLLFLIAFATAFRYYYSTCLVGIFLLGSLFVPEKSGRKADDKT